ncbi:MAG: TrkH family potassium uptake protein [Gammaproteobacteria bacterium]|nr:TrkH family potassium uptake protein [Gammaproteobacteria bacterium]
MQYIVIQRVTGLLLIIFSTTLLPPILVSQIYDDGASKSFLIAYGITLVTGLVLWLPVSRVRREVRLRDGFIIVTLFWTLLALVGALPFAIAEMPHMPFTDSFFESMSGLTTTGATVLTGIDDLPQSIRFYRQQLQWLGGMGIVVLAVAVMPMLGVGGMQLYRAETPGPMKDNKLTPRITETAKALWYIYLGLTASCAFAYWVAGMSLFDAVGHSFSTIAIGGFSTHDQSIGYFNNIAIEIVGIVFMLLAGINFALHFLSWRSRSAKPYFVDTEVKVYMGIVVLISITSILVLHFENTYDTWQQAIHHGVFQAVSVATTTGFTTTGFHLWPLFLPALLIVSSFVGGCAGSTAGGMKVIRALLLYKQGKREILRLIHPDALFPIKVGGKPMSDRVISAVWGFFALYVFCFSCLSLLMIASGNDMVTAFSAVAACLNNLGPGLGEVAGDYGGLNVASKWILCVAMLLGRLELFTLLVILSPSFWRT